MTIMSMNGLYICVGNKEYFWKTDRKNITDKCALEFLNKIQNHMNMFCEILTVDIQRAKRQIMPAVLTVERTDGGMEYVNISGENFSGYGDNLQQVFFD